VDQATRDNIHDYLRLSHDELGTADLLLGEGKFRACLSRCYYAMFYAASALLLARDIVRSKHSGVESALHQFFVKPGLLGPDYGMMYSDAREDRELSDYELLFTPAEEMARVRAAEARQFVARIEDLLQREFAGDDQ